MADDPNRDILPVKEGSCIGTCRSALVTGMNPELRERHAVCKLDRYELEDRYLRLLDDMQALKKSSNAQEDKLKCLTTKLMRITASSRPCLAALTLHDEKIKIETLERENAKLKDKLFILRNQIVNYCVLRRSPSRRCISSGAMTCRSEGARPKTNSSNANFRSSKDDVRIEIQSYTARIEEFEADKKSMMTRISELEDELENYQEEMQRRKESADEENLRLLEKLKQQEEQLETADALNASLRKELKILQKLLDETSNNNDRISATLLAEKQRSKMTELDGVMNRSKDSQMELREKDEQIRDLMSEIRILQEHNTELISLSTKYSGIEVDNVELRKKISEQQIDNGKLKSAYSNEQANIAALQAANGQLMEKLQELQKNMDSLTIQLKSFKNQNGKSEKSEEIKRPRTMDRPTSMSPRSPQKSDKGDYSPEKLQKSLQTCEKLDAAVQTEIIETADKTVCPSEHLNKTFCSSERLNDPQFDKSSPLRNHGKPVESIGNGKLSRDDMLKLLDQAQINVPLDSHNAVKMRQLEGFSPGHRQRESCGCCEVSGCHYDSDNQQIVRTLTEILNDPDNPMISKNRELSENFDENNNVRNVNIQRSTRNEIVENPVCKFSEIPISCCNCYASNDNYSERYSEGGDCPCDYPGDSFRAAFEKIQMSLRKTLSNIQTSREEAALKHYEVLPKPRNKVDCRKLHLKCINTRKCPEDSEKSHCPILLSNDQGFLEIHITSLQLSSFASHHIFENFNANPLLFVSCDFCGEGSIFTPTQRHQELTFNTSCVYRVSKISKFLDSLLKDHMFFHVHMTQLGGTPCVIAQGKISVKDILDFPQNKLYYIVHMECTVPCYHDANFGELFFWIRLSCDVDRVRSFKKQRDESCGIEGGPVKMKEDPAEMIRISNRILLSGDRNPRDHPRDSRSSENLKRERDSGSSENLKRERDSRSSENLKRERDSRSSENLKRERDSRSSENLKRERDSRSSENLKRERDSRSSENFKRERDSGSSENLSANLKTIHERKTTISEDFDSERNSIRSNVSLRSKLIFNDRTSDPRTTYGEFRSDTKQNGSWRDWVGDVQVRKDEIGESQLKIEKSGEAIDLENLFDDESLQGSNENWLRNTKKSWNTQVHSSDAITIRLERLSLFPRCSLLNDPDVHQLYVEFSFLGYYGLDLETVSVPIPEAAPYHLFFNYMRKFSIDAKSHSEQRKKLQEMLADEVSSTIKFTIVNEPRIEDMETKECVEVGHAYLNLREHVLSGGHHDISLFVSNIDASDTIGTLKITLLGADSIRDCLPTETQ